MCSGILTANQIQKWKFHGFSGQQFGCHARFHGPLYREKCFASGTMAETLVKQPFRTLTTCLNTADIDDPKAQTSMIRFSRGAIRRTLSQKTFGLTFGWMRFAVSDLVSLCPGHGSDLTSAITVTKAKQSVLVVCILRPLSSEQAQVDR